MTNLNNINRTNQRQSEIFRHLRPQGVDSDRLELRPLRNGGISFLLRPLKEGHYSYWIYMSPLDTEFSAKAAVKRLRFAADSGVNPWNNIVLDTTPLLDQLQIDVVNQDLPTEAGQLFSEIKWITAKSIKLLGDLQHTAAKSSNIYA